MRNFLLIASTALLTACASGVKTVSNPETGIAMDAYFAQKGGVVAVGCLWRDEGSGVSSPGSCTALEAPAAGILKSALGAAGIAAGAFALSGAVGSIGADVIVNAPAGALQ